jgi:hypothetical protein
MALSAPTQRIYDLDVALNYYPQAAVAAYHGGIAVLRAGYVRPGATAVGDVCVGVFDFDAHGGIAGMTGISDNSAGSPGDLTANVRRTIARVKNSANADLIAQANVGSPCFVVDDETVALTDGGGTRSVAGTIRRVDTAGVWVEFGSVNGTSLAAEITSRQALATDLASSTGTTLAGVLKGTQVATVATGNVVGAVPVEHLITVADGATADIDVVLTHKTLVTGVTVIKGQAAGGAGDTITVKNTATAITDAMSINVAAKTVVRMGTCDDAQSTINAGGTLRITRTKASVANVGCTVIVHGLRVA